MTMRMIFIIVDYRIIWIMTMMTMMIMNMKYQPIVEYELINDGLTLEWSLFFSIFKFVIN